MTLQLGRRDVVQAALGLALIPLAGRGAPARSEEREGADRMRKDIVLLHGANEGAWCFGLFRKVLECLGWTCHTPT
jgi:hypothetical protein